MNRQLRLHPRQVEAFRGIMLTGSITLAAQMMNVTQPAVSRLIRDFEIAVDLRLFDRDGRRLVARTEAIRLYREVERFYLGLDHIGAIADDIRGSRGLRLRIAAMPALAASCLPEILSGLMHTRPDVSVVFDVESTDHICDMITNHQYDLGFVFGSPRHAGLPAQPLATTHAVVAMRPDHPLAALPGITPRDLVAYRLLLPGRKTPVRQSFDTILAQAGLSPATLMETSMANCCSFAARGDGVAISDPVTVAERSGELVSRPLTPAIAISYVAIRPPQAPGFLLADEIIDKAKAWLGVRLSGVLAG
jgi:DNA-binding transcriptional LysR family regulator